MTTALNLAKLLDASADVSTLTLVGGIPKLITTSTSLLYNTSAINSTSTFRVAPSGTSTIASLVLDRDSSGTSGLSFSSNGTTSSKISALGAPLVIDIDGTQALKITTNRGISFGDSNVGTAPGSPQVLYFLLSNGDASPSWTDRASAAIALSLYNYAR